MSSYIAIPIHSKVPRDSLGNIHYFEDLPDDSAAKKYNRIFDAFLGSSEEWLCIHHHDCEIRCPDAEIESQLKTVYGLGVRVAGVIGTMCLYRSFQWWQPQRPAVTAGAVIQGFEGGKEQPMIDMAGIRTDMASVDGCIMWIHRSILQEGLRMDEDIPGWHCYDCEICLNTLRMGHKVGILNVCVKHNSEGKFDAQVFEQSRKCMDDKWNKIFDFPVVSGVSKCKL